MRDTFKEMFTDIGAVFGSLVTIVNGENSAQGYVRYDTLSSMEKNVKEIVSGRAMVLVDDIGDLSYLSLITIEGVKCFVGESHTDPLKVVNTFQFTSTTPVLDGDA